MRTAFLAFCSVIAYGQIRHLTTDYTGSVLYFSGEFRLNDTDPPHSKIFLWDAAEGLRTYLTRERLWIGNHPGTIQVPAYTNYYKLDSPSVSRDNKRLLVVGHQDCSGCVIDKPPRAEVAVLEEKRENPVFSFLVRETVGWTNQAELSANGDYIVHRNGRGGANGVIQGCAIAPATCKYVASEDWPPTPGRPVKQNSWAGSPQSITDKGLIVFRSYQYDLRLATPALSRPLGNTTPGMAPIVNAAGTVVLFERVYEDGIPRCLYSLNIVTGQETLLFVDADVEMTGITESTSPLLLAAPYHEVEVPKLKAAIDEAGDQILVLAKEAAGLPRQWLFLIHPDGSGGRWLAFTTEGYREAVLSGDGKVIFAVTESGRLMRVDATTEEVMELLPRTPWIGRVSGAAWRGARNRILGGGFSDRSCEPERYPAPEELCGVRVELDGKRMPVLSVSPREVQFQIPWEFEAPEPWITELALKLTAQSQSTLKQAEIPYKFPLNPNPEEPGPLHEDGTAVTILNPVRLGETFRIQYTGFDRPSGTTGVPPEEFVATPPPDCRYSTWKLTATDIVSFGLVPGLVGVSELRLRVPEDIDTNGQTPGVLCVASPNSPPSKPVFFPLAK